MQHFCALRSLSQLCVCFTEYEILWRPVEGEDSLLFLPFGLLSFFSCK